MNAPLILKENWLDAAAAQIDNGNVVALAFEQLFGLAADALNADAVAKSAQIKGRPAYDRGDKPVSVILPHMDAVAQVCADFTPVAQQLAAQHWPGPLTLLVPAREGLPLPLIGPGGLIGIRVAGDCPAAQLSRRTGKILTATSANRRGAAEPLEHTGLLELEEVDLIVAGAVPGPPGSTIVNASGATPVILRPGVLPL